MNKENSIIIAGANGFLGTVLSKHLHSRGYTVYGLERKQTSSKHYRTILWDGHRLGPWTKALEGSQALINLAGRSVNCRYGTKNRTTILKSRVESTQILGEAISQCENPPRVWLNASTATIYRHAEDRPQDEHSGEIGHGFSVDVAKAWEDAFFQCNSRHSVRKVALRTSLVLGRQAGTVLHYFTSLARLGLGGSLGPGTQRVSWIHELDFAAAVQFLLTQEECYGAFNLAAPDVPTNAIFMKRIRESVGQDWGLSSTKSMLNIGAWLLRTETELLLKSRWVQSARLEQAGFSFRWPSLQTALESLIHPVEPRVRSAMGCLP